MVNDARQEEFGIPRLQHHWLCANIPWLQVAVLLQK
jgi:hypothetical protein